MNFLVTGGGTREPIDSVRFITNLSTGATAAELIDSFVAEGHSVTAVLAEGAQTPKMPVPLTRFTTFENLNSTLEKVLAEGAFDGIIHLAAVADFSVAPASGKIESGQALNLQLKPTFKIVNRLKSYARARSPRVVAFKLTDTPDREEQTKAVQKLFQTPTVDCVVHNDMGDRRNGRSLFRVYLPGYPGEAVGEYKNAAKLAAALTHWMGAEQ